MTERNSDFPKFPKQSEVSRSSSKDFCQWNYDFETVAINSEAVSLNHRDLYQAATKITVFMGKIRLRPRRFLHRWIAYFCAKLGGPLTSIPSCAVSTSNVIGLNRYLTWAEYIETWPAPSYKGKTNLLWKPRYAFSSKNASIRTAPTFLERTISRATAADSSLPTAEVSIPTPGMRGFIVA